MEICGDGNSNTVLKKTTQEGLGTLIYIIL